MSRTKVKHDHGHNNNNNSCNHNNNNNTNSTNKNGPPASKDSLEASKLDYAVADYMRNQLPNKEAMFVGIKRVNYFIGSKAVDLLMQSKWASQSPIVEGEPTFKSRHDAVIFLNNLLLKKFYHRAKKVVKISDGAKKKYKLDMHDIQTFEDSNQPYVWLYEPTSLKAWLLCFGVIFGVIAVCLFPLWPPIIRTWVYWLCIAGLVFLSSILSLAVLRHIIFFALWTITFGKIQLWILPNLTEDVGFFESFWPLYQFETGEGGVGDGGEGNPSSASSGTSAEGGGGGHSHQD